MYTNRKFSAIAALAVFAGLTCFCLPGRGEPNSAPAASPSTRATPSVRPSRQVYVPMPYVIHDRSTDILAAEVGQRQDATDQQITTVRQDLTAIDTDLNTLFARAAKQETTNTQILQKLDRIEQMLGNVNGRLKKIEERVGQQDVQLRKLKNAKAPAVTAQEPNDLNKPVTQG
jgi:septal ring factor EnvC (AmiA/AmiB activator)